MGGIDTDESTEGRGALSNVELETNVAFDTEKLRDIVSDRTNWGGDWRGPETETGVGLGSFSMYSSECSPAAGVGRAKPWVKGDDAATEAAKALEDGGGMTPPSSLPAILGLVASCGEGSALWKGVGKECVE